MISLLPRDRGRTAGEQSGLPDRGDEGSSGGALRKLLLALGVVALAYFVARRFGSGDTLPGNGHEISIGGSDDESGDESAPGADEETDSEMEWGGSTTDDNSGSDAADSGGETESDAGEESDGEEDDGDQTGADGEAGETPEEPDEPPEAIEERTEADADEEPMEPGEMTVDEDVVEELDDDASADEGDEDSES